MCSCLIIKCHFIHQILRLIHLHAMFAVPTGTNCNQSSLSQGASKLMPRSFIWCNSPGGYLIKVSLMEIYYQSLFKPGLMENLKLLPPS